MKEMSFCNIINKRLATIRRYEFYTFRSTLSYLSVVASY